MKVPSSTPIDTDEEPTNSSSIWNQTISYISAAQPLPTKSSSRIGQPLFGRMRVGCVYRVDRFHRSLFLLVMRALIVRLQHIVAEVAVEIAPHAVDVVCL